MQVEDRSGRATPRLQAATDALIAAAGKDPQIAAFYLLPPGVPQLYANVDRVKAKKGERRGHQRLSSPPGLPGKFLY